MKPEELRELKQLLDNAGISLKQDVENMDPAKYCAAKGICNMDNGYVPGPCPRTCVTECTLCVTECIKCVTDCINTCITDCVKCTLSVQ